MAPVMRGAPREWLVARDIYAAAAVDFGVFAVVLFPVLHDGKQMKQAPYIELLVEALMAATPGGNTRLIVNLPPGHMKSLLISVLYTAWRLGVDPSVRILCISYGDDLAHQLSRLTRRVMQSRPYRRISREPCWRSRPRTFSPRRRAASVWRPLSAARRRDSAPISRSSTIRCSRTRPSRK